jgi:hypothetical protein
MANTYVAIATTTVGSGGAASIDFTSIPATYTDLRVVYSLRNSTETSGTLYVKFNNSTTSFSFRHVYGNGASASSVSGSVGEAGVTNPSDFTASTFSNGSIYIPNYAGSTNKSYSVDSVNENNSTTAISLLLAGLWSNTSAINQVTLYPTSGNFAQYSTATLYGIKNS